MGRFSEKQMLILTIAGSLVFVLGFGGLIWWDLDRIHAAEITDDDPAAAEVTDPELWGERRKIQEIERQIEATRAEAELIPKREQDVIVFREILARDTAILPSADEVNRLATTIGDFERLSGVTLTRVSDLNTAGSGQKAIARIPIKLTLSGSFDETLKFMNLFETLDRLVNVTAFSITAASDRGGAGGVPKHSVSLDLVTFMYTSDVGITKPVEISNYERRKNDPVVQKLIRQKKAAKVEKYQLKPRINRRDPLLDPRRSADEVEADADPADIEMQKRLCSKLKFDVELLKEDVRQEAFYKQNRKYVPLSQIKPLIDSKVARLGADITAADPRIKQANLRQILHDDVIAPFEEIKSQRGIFEGPVVVGRSQVEEFRLKMVSLLDTGKHMDCVRTHDEFTSLVKGQEVAEDAQPLIDEMDDLRHAAQVHIDFDRLELRYSGLILQGDASVVLVRSADEPSSRARRVGDTVDKFGRCRIVEITKNHVKYDFDGFEIEHPTNAGKLRQMHEVR